MPSWHSANFQFFCFFDPKFFVGPAYIVYNFMFKFDAFSSFFVIFGWLIWLCWIFIYNSNLNCKCMEYYNLVLRKMLFMVFGVSDVATCLKHSQFFTTAYTCDNMTPRQVSWFLDFVWTLYNFKTLFRQVARHVTWRRCAKFDASSWIGTQHAPINMNNIFLKHYIAIFHAPAVQIWHIQKKSKNRNKLRKYTKQNQNWPKF